MGLQTTENFFFIITIGFGLIWVIFLSWSPLPYGVVLAFKPLTWEAKCEIPPPTEKTHLILHGK